MTQAMQARRPAAASVAEDMAERVSALDWTVMAAALDQHGAATTGALLTGDECAALAACYDDDARFRSRVVMARHGFGRVEF